MDQGSPTHKNASSELALMFPAHPTGSEREKDDRTRLLESKGVET